MGTDSMMTSDVVGLTTIPPVSRRAFMSATAAVAAGYTLAAGPVRAEVITTDSNGLQTGDARIKVGSEEMPAYFARPAGNAKAPVIIVAMVCRALDGSLNLHTIAHTTAHYFMPRAGLAATR